MNGPYRAQQVITATDARRIANTAIAKLAITTTEEYLNEIIKACGRGYLFVEVAKPTIEGVWPVVIAELQSYGFKVNDHEYRSVSVIRW